MPGFLVFHLKRERKHQHESQTHPGSKDHQESVPSSLEQQRHLVVPLHRAPTGLHQVACPSQPPHERFIARPRSPGFPPLRGGPLRSLGRPATYNPSHTATMHGLQEIIYANREVARKHKARALRKRAERAQQVIAECIVSSRGISFTTSKCRSKP